MYVVPEIVIVAVTGQIVVVWYTMSVVTISEPASATELEAGGRAEGALESGGGANETVETTLMLDVEAGRAAPVEVAEIA